MKITFTFLSLWAGTLAMAQTAAYTQVNTSINETNNSELAIQIKAERADGQQVQYSRTFDVRGLSKQEKEALKTRVLDSLGLNTAPPAPPTPPAPVSPPAGLEVVKLLCSSCTGRMRLEINGNGYSYAQTHNTATEKTPFLPLELTMKPGEYRLAYWQNNVLQIQKSFTVKVGEANVITVK